MNFSLRLDLLSIVLTTISAIGLVLLGLTTQAIMFLAVSMVFEFFAVHKSIQKPIEPFRPIELVLYMGLIMVHVFGFIFIAYMGGAL